MSNFERIVYQIDCKHCDNPIRLPGATLERQFHNPTDLSTGYQPTVVGCPQCNRASIYTRFPQRGLEQTPYSTPQAYASTLQCGKSGCGEVVRAIVPTGENGYREVMLGWIYLRDAQCANGHRFDPQCQCAECSMLPSRVAE